jgi:hypothetical protein
MKKNTFGPKPNSQFVARIVSRESKFRNPRKMIFGRPGWPSHNQKVSCRVGQETITANDVHQLKRRVGEVLQREIGRGLAGLANWRFRL